jgi:hypothetical protein
LLSGSSQTRHHGSDRDRQYFSDLSVRRIFNITEQNDFAKDDWQLLDCAPNCVDAGILDEQRLGSGGSRGQKQSECAHVRVRTLPADQAQRTPQVISESCLDFLAMPNCA